MIACKNCKSNHFFGTTTRNAKIRLEQEDGNLLPIVVEEYEEEIIDISITVCSSCNTKINNPDKDLIEVIECASCKSLVEAGDIEENDNCFICNNPRTDLVGLSEMQYRRMIIELEQQLANQKTTKKRKKKEKALEVEPEVIVDQLVETPIEVAEPQIDVVEGPISDDLLGLPVIDPVETQVENDLSVNEIQNEDSEFTPIEE